MSAADPGEGPDQGGFLGFRTFADDTLRPSDGPAATAPAASAAPRRVYDDLAYDDLRVEPWEPYDTPGEARRPRRSIWLTSAGFIALALLVGTGVALTRGAFGEGPATTSTPAPPIAPAVAPAGSTASAPPDGEPKTPAAPSAPPRLDNLRVEPNPRVAASPRVASGAPPAVTGASTRRPAPPRRSAPDPIGEALSKVLNEPLAPPRARPAPEPEPQALPPLTAAAARPPLGIQPSFDCRYARSYAQQMICDDPALAAADRRMSRAYVQALAAGVPEADLRAEQNDWMSLREDAARRSPAAVRSVYERRIQDLRALAAAGPD